MKKNYIIYLSFLSTLFAQAPIIGFDTTNNGMLDSMREELMVQQDNIEDLDLAPNPTPELETISIDMEEKDIPLTEEEILELEEMKEFFGYTYFKRRIDFYDNVPTPADFKLGAGDEIVLSLWGEINKQETFTVSKDGSIYYKNIGFISLANKTINEAEEILKEKLSKTYSTLNDSVNSTRLIVELGKLRSINVYFSGNISEPGIHIVHPFSDIFSAIIQAGGVQIDGSLRNVQLIRNREIIHTIDFYDFFTDGKSDFNKIRILEGDVIHIPQVNNRSEIVGEVERPSHYELLKGETLADLIEFAGGFTVNASNTIMAHWIVPLDKRLSIDDTMRNVALNPKEAKTFIMKPGTTVNIEPVRVIPTAVRIIGRVKVPGYYPASKNLREVLDMAGGFSDPLYSQSIRKDEIIILRKDSSQFYALEFKTSYEESSNFDLVPDDKIFVYEDSNYRNNPTVRIEGEVNRAGTFAFKKGMTIKDVIDLAEGLTPFANPDAIVLYDEWSPELEKNELEDLGMGHSPTMQDPVYNTTLDFVISENTLIKVKPMKNHVLVDGSVYNPGIFTYNGPKTVRYYINLAGGVKSDAIFKDSYIQRTNGKIEKLNQRNVRWKRAYAGDFIFIPTNPTPKEFDPTKFTSDIVNILTNLATIIFIVDSNSN